MRIVDIPCISGAPKGHDVAISRAELMSAGVAHFPASDLWQNWPKISRHDVRGSVPGRTDKADVSAQVDVISPSAPRVGSIRPRRVA